MEKISVSGMVRKLRFKTSDIVSRYTEHLTNTMTSAEAALDPKSLRSLGLGTIGLVRQHGIRITPDQLDDYIAHGNLSTAKDLQSSRTRSRPVISMISSSSLSLMFGLIFLRFSSMVAPKNIGFWSTIATCLR